MPGKGRFEIKVNIVEGDHIIVTKPRDVYEEPFVVTGVETYASGDPSFKFADRKMVDIVPLSKYKTAQKRKDTIPKIEVHGNVENLAGRDISNYNFNTTIFFNALEKAISESEDIPQDQKAPLINKIREIAKNPYITGISTSIFTNALMHILH